MHRICALDGDFQLRFMTSHPKDASDRLIEAMATEEKIVKHFHLPVQSGSERILLAMRRPYATKDVVQAAELATELMPGLGLGCDIITGFPGETDLEFAATRGLLNRLPFNNAHIFPYSSRPGTLAAGFPLQVPRPIRAARAHELSRIMKQKRIKFARSFVGKTVEIVVEDAEKSSGWTGEYLSARPVSGTAPRKSSLRLFITKSKDDRLYGRITT
jgi:tRNA A37 methylthiotransferase MiaB